MRKSSRNQSKSEVIVMDIEEIAKKVTLKDLRPIAKEHGIKTSCVKKIDIVKQLPEDVLEELAKK